MQNDMLNTIDDKALETVSGGGIGSTIGGLVDDALKGVGEAAGGVFSLFGSVLSGLGDFISKVGKAF
jgi:hypothetical protein